MGLIFFSGALVFDQNVICGQVIPNCEAGKQNKIKSIFMVGAWRFRLNITYMTYCVGKNYKTYFVFVLFIIFKYWMIIFAKR